MAAKQTTGGREDIIPSDFWFKKKQARHPDTDTSGKFRQSPGKWPGYYDIETPRADPYNPRSRSLEPTSTKGLKADRRRRLIEALYAK